MKRKFVNGRAMTARPASFTSSRATKRYRVKHELNTGVFIGPSVNGTDKRYVKVITGDVDDRMPSFAR